MEKMSVARPTMQGGGGGLRQQIKVGGDFCWQVATSGHHWGKLYHACLFVFLFI